jgi:YVTN family beta-propeller protein
MAEVAGGTVTFLLAEIDGAEALMRELRGAYGSVVGEQRRILRRAASRHRGTEIESEGAASLFAFRSAADAAFAAAAAQRALAQRAWPEGMEVDIRMAIHTAGAGGRGLGIRRGAAIMAAAHGGQVLLSETTSTELVGNTLAGLSLGDLGEHELDALDRPEHLYQLEGEGLPRAFPPPRASDDENAFGGRDGKLEQAARWAVWRQRQRRRNRIAAIAGAFVIAVGLTAALVNLLGGSRHPLTKVDADAVGLIDPETNTIVGEMHVGPSPSGVAISPEAAWVANTDGDSVSRIDTPERTVVDTISVGRSPGAIAACEGAVWVANSRDGTVTRIDPGSDQPVDTIPVGTDPSGIACAAGKIWVANSGDGTITSIDPAHNTPAPPLPIAASQLAAGGGSLWAGRGTSGRVVRIDPTTGRVTASIAVGDGLAGLAFGDGALWVANASDGTVSRLDPERNAVTRVVAAGDGPAGVAVGANEVWVTNEGGRDVVRIDPRTGRVVHRFVIGNSPVGVAISDNGVLVSVRKPAQG